VTNPDIARLLNCWSGCSRSPWSKPAGQGPPRKHTCAYS